MRGWAVMPKVYACLVGLVSEYSSRAVRITFDNPIMYVAPVYNM